MYWYRLFSLLLRLLDVLCRLLFLISFFQLTPVLLDVLCCLLFLISSFQLTPARTWCTVSFIVSHFVFSAYSCAYFGDILIQGSLYITPNWFCFHSRILGIEKTVTTITRLNNLQFNPLSAGDAFKRIHTVFPQLKFDRNWTNMLV